MASIIEKYASEDVTLLQGPVIADGKTTFAESIPAKAGFLRQRFGPAFEKPEKHAIIICSESKRRADQWL